MEKKAKLTEPTVISAKSFASIKNSASIAKAGRLK
jgi:hypothetical protein